MKCPVRPETLFAVLVTVCVLLLSSSTARAATTANGTAVSADAEKNAAEKGQRKKSKKDSKDPATIRRQLKRLAERHEASQDRVDALARQQSKLGHRITKTRKRHAASRARVAQTAHVAYTSGPANSAVAAFTADEDPTEIARRMTTLTLLSESDNAAIRDAGRDRRALDAQRGKLRSAKKDARAEQQKLASERKKLNAALLEAARALAERRSGKASRAATMTSGGACPVGQPRQLSDTWGMTRSGGRAHEGTDMLAPTGTPIYAVEDGTVSEAGADGLGGITIILKGESGDSYYYAHNSANLVGTGEKVVAGQHIAKVGMTGNAQGTVPHLHFERWPGGGNPVNPFPFVKALCG